MSPKLCGYIEANGKHPEHPDTSIKEAADQQRNQHYHAEHTTRNHTHPAALVYIVGHRGGPFENPVEIEKGDKVIPHRFGIGGGIVIARNLTQDCVKSTNAEQPEDPTSDGDCDQSQFRD